MQFDKIAFEIEPTMFPGKFCARVVAWHRGVCVYSKELNEQASFRATIDDLGEELRIVNAQFSRNKLVADPLELPPTTKVQ